MSKTRRRRRNDDNTAVASSRADADAESTAKSQPAGRCNGRGRQAAHNETRLEIVCNIVIAKQSLMIVRTRPCETTDNEKNRVFRPRRQNDAW